jgi:hypothetical protein
MHSRSTSDRTLPESERHHTPERTLPAARCGNIVRAAGWSASGEYVPRFFLSSYKEPSPAW